VLPPFSVATTSGAPVAILDDGTVLARGTTPDTDVYRVRVRLPAGELRILQLECLPHPSLPAQGPGRAHNGNFVLTGVRMQVGGKPVAFRDAVC
jgi:hypothetical protein